MSKIRESARGQECCIRIPGVCNGDVDTTVLAHLPAMAMGGKGLDIHAAFSCDACHSLVDRRVPNKTEFSGDLIKIWFLEGMIDTQKILVEKGLLTFK